MTNPIKRIKPNLKSNETAYSHILLKFDSMFLMCNPYNMCMSVHVSAGDSGAGGGHSRYNHYASNYPTNPAASYTGGLTEEEQIQAAIRNSLNDRGEAEEGGCG